MKQIPVVIVKPGTVSKKDIERAEKKGMLCIIECAEPESVRFLDPPAGTQIEERARAAYKLMRVIVTTPQHWSRSDLIAMWSNFLINYDEPKRVEPVKSAP